MDQLNKKKEERLTGVGGVHSTAGSGTGARVTDNVLALSLGNGSGEVGSVGLESGDDVEGSLVAGGCTGLDGASVDHDGGAIDATHGDQASGHVLVASGEGDVGVIPLSAHDLFESRVGLPRISTQLSSNVIKVQSKDRRHSLVTLDRG